MKPLCAPANLQALRVMRSARDDVTAGEKALRVTPSHAAWTVVNTPSDDESPLRVTMWLE